MTRDDVQRWLDRYVEAWRTYDADAIGELFSEDATYRYHPYDEEAVEGRAAIVEAWRDSQDAPESWRAYYDAYAVEGDRAVGLGKSIYLATADAPETVFHNVFVLAFDADGRCTSFTDIYMQQPGATPASE